MDSEWTQVPLPELPSDAMRQGLSTFGDRLVGKHPVEEISKKDTEMENVKKLRDVFGAALSARMHIEKQILERPGRLPPLLSSNIGSDSYFGRLSDFSCEDYLGLHEFSPQIPPDVHSQMEEAYGLGTKPVKRGFL